MDFNSYTNVTFLPAEKDILMFLYISRGAKTKQILNYFSSFPTTKERGNLAKYLRNLKKKKLIHVQSIIDSREKLYFLSEEGHYICSNYFKYEKESLFMDGYNGDVGDFPYSIYTPPKTYVSHFLMNVDLLLDVIAVRKKLSWNINLINSTNKTIKNLMNIHKVREKDAFTISNYTIKNFNIGIDRRYKKDKNKFKNFLKPLTNDLKYRDNLHAAVVLTENNKKYRYRPDGEIMIKDQLFAVEIDRGNERKGALKEKFSSYKQHFNRLEKSGYQLPVAILFIAPDFTYESARIKRWHTVSSAYLEEIGEYAQKINLVMLTVSEVKKYLYNQTNNLSTKTYDVNLKEAIDNNVITSFGNVTNEAYNMLVSFYAEEQNIVYTKPLYTFVHIEGYETRGWAIFKQLAKDYELEKSVGVGELQSFFKIVPIISYNHIEPKLIHTSLLKSHFKSLLKTVVFYNLTTGDLKTVTLDEIKESSIDI